MENDGFSRKGMAVSIRKRKRIRKRPRRDNPLAHRDWVLNLRFAGKRPLNEFSESFDELIAEEEQAKLEGLSQEERNARIDEALAHKAAKGIADELVERIEAVDTLVEPYLPAMTASDMR